jgi:biotin synthase
MNLPQNLKIRVSYGTAICLGLVKARQDIAPTTAYLLWDSGCIGSCSFCPRANGHKKDKRLSRILWPEFEFSIILNLLQSSKNPFHRVCLQTGYNPATESLLQNIAQSLFDSGLTTSITLNPGQTKLASDLLKAGADHIGIGLDCATEQTYRIHKKRNWKNDYPSLINLCHKHSGKIEVHLIFGLGDSEEDFCKAIHHLIQNGAKISLFALTPVNKGQAPEHDAYRRTQLFRYLCENKILPINSFLFSSGKLKEIKDLQKIIVKNKNLSDCFRTSGCDNCNRPYYNERPGQRFYNYPRPLTKEEFQKELESTGLIET